MSPGVAFVVGLAIVVSVTIMVNMYVVSHLVEEKGGPTLFVIFTVGLYTTVLDIVMVLMP